MTPKNLLRLPAASSAIAELTSGGFRPVIDDERISQKAKVRRVAICSGKVFYDIDAAREGNDDADVAVIRLEQFYPFPYEGLRSILESYENAREIVWVQEEPKNMGGWTFAEPRLREIAGSKTVAYVGRDSSASPATGSYTVHNLEQAKLISEVLAS